MKPSSPDLDARSRQLLRTLIARYIQDGEPVGSRTLAQHAGLDVSPATIRNILADLEDAGLLASPHTSAGRIPTPQGYRVFVDSLVQMQPLAEREVARLRAELPAGTGTQALLGNASELLALADQGTGGRGADSSATTDAAHQAALTVAGQTGGAVAVSGVVDLILDGHRELRLDRGTPLLTRVTGTGCLLGALTAACAAVEPDPVQTALAATTWMDLAGEAAAARAAGPGSFRMHLLDALDEIGR